MTVPKLRDAILALRRQGLSLEQAKHFVRNGLYVSGADAEAFVRSVRENNRHNDVVKVEEQQ
jgi:hypothetical protein